MWHAQWLLAQVVLALPTATVSCPGEIRVVGHGSKAVVPARLVSGPDHGRASVTVPDGNTVRLGLDSRAYLARSCKLGGYNPDQYAEFDLRGRTVRSSIDVSEAGCGCHASLKFVAIQKGVSSSLCDDKYCDAAGGGRCRASCAELNILDANQFAWHSNLRIPQLDAQGFREEYRGDRSDVQYGSRGRCIDTRQPFDVTVTFPLTPQSTLAAMEVMLSQKTGTPCVLVARINTDVGILELAKAFNTGVTPVMSFGSSDDEVWLDSGNVNDRPRCLLGSRVALGGTVRFTNFSIQPVVGASRSKGEQGSTRISSRRRMVIWDGDKCAGHLHVSGHGTLHLVAAGWSSAANRTEGQVTPQAIIQQQTVGSTIVPQPGAVVYFAAKAACKPGAFNRASYAALSLLGKTIRYTVDLSRLSCGIAKRHFTWCQCAKTFGDLTAVTTIAMLAAHVAFLAPK